MNKEVLLVNKIPFKTIGICSAILTVLIILRCAVSIGRVLYYGGNYWLTVIQADPWLYVSVASAAISVVCFSMIIIRERSKDAFASEYDIQEDDDSEDEDYDDDDEEE